MVTRVMSPGALRDPLESKVQEAVFEWMRVRYFDFAGCRLRLRDYAFSNMNGTRVAGSAAQRAIYINAMKKRGMTPGVSDITIAVPRGKYHGFFLELKREKSGVTSDEQEKFLARMQEMGYYTDVALGLKDAIFKIDLYLAFGEFNA